MSFKLLHPLNVIKARGKSALSPSGLVPAQRAEVSLEYWDVSSHGCFLPHRTKTDKMATGKNGSSLLPHRGQRIDRKYQWILLTGQSWHHKAQLVIYGWVFPFVSREGIMIVYLYIDVVHSSLFRSFLAKQAGSLGPSLCLLCALPGHNSWMPPTLSLCNIQNDLTWISPLCALNRNFYLSPITFKHFIGTKPQTALICLTFIISVCLV